MDVLVDKEWRRAPLRALVEQQLVPFVDSVRPRLDVSGPDAALTPEAAQAIGLAIHELATNAVKHGALSTASGRVTLCWHYDTQSGQRASLILRWTERGGPVVEEPVRRGFGHFVLSRLVASTLGVDPTLAFDRDGVAWAVAIPPHHVEALGDET